MALVKQTTTGQTPVVRRPNDLFETLFADWSTSRPPAAKIPGAKG